MKHRRTNGSLFFLLFLFAVCILGQKSYALAEESIETDAVILTQSDGTTTEYVIENTQIQYGGKDYTCTVSPVQVDGIWMLPIKSVFSDIFECYYFYSEEEKKVIIKTPGRDYSITFTENSNVAIINNASKIMPAKMLLGTQKSTGDSEYMVPLQFVLESLGYTYSMQDSASPDNGTTHTIQVQSYYLFHKEEDNISYDEEKFENALAGIAVTENEKKTKNYLKVSTLQTLSSKNIVIAEDSKENTVTFTYLKTYNPFGDITEQINSEIIQKIEVWENEEASTCIRIYYNQKYVYSQKVTEAGCTVTFSKGSFSMKVVMPEGVTFSKITTTDQYWNKKFLITIPGNHVSFLKKYAPFINSTAITGATVAKTSDGNTKITVSTNGLKGYKLTKGTDFFTVKVGSPQSIYQNIVLLDAGHGGKDSGAVGNGLKEKKLCLAILYTQAKQYFEANNSTVKAYWTRHNDTFINLYTRPTLSEKYHADLFVSLHMNSASSSSANGTEVYYSKDNNKKNSSGLTSKIFATSMQNTLVDTLGNKSRGVKQAGFVVNKYNTVPSILIELGFVSGKSDSKKLKKVSYQKKAAKAIYQGIADIFEKYPTGR